MLCIPNLKFALNTNGRTGHSCTWVLYQQNFCFNLAESFDWSLVHVISEDEMAFDMLYCVAFEMLDAHWLAMRASYMEFNVTSLCLFLSCSWATGMYCLVDTVLEMVFLANNCGIILVSAGCIESNSHAARERDDVGRCLLCSGSSSLQPLVPFKNLDLLIPVLLDNYLLPMVICIIQQVCHSPISNMLLQRCEALLGFNYLQV